MLFSTKSRYGIRAIYILVKNHAENCPISIKNISSMQGISEQYLEQIFSKLKKADIIKSVRGQKGGYILADDPDKISMGQVIRALEGPLAPVECVEDIDCCERTDSCCAISIWSSIYNDINNVVDSYTLADMIEQ